MRKLALVALLLANLGGVAMAAPMGASSHELPHNGPAITPRFTSSAMPSGGGGGGGGRRSFGVHGVCTDGEDLVIDDQTVAVDAFARVPQLDGGRKDIAIQIDGKAISDFDSLDHALMRGFEQVLNLESARQGRTVDALLAHGAMLGNRADDQHETLYKFDLDAELRIVRQAYLLRNPKNA